MPMNANNTATCLCYAVLCGVYTGTSGKIIFGNGAKLVIHSSKFLTFIVIVYNRYGL